MSRGREGRVTVLPAVQVLNANLRLILDTLAGLVQTVTWSTLVALRLSSTKR